MVCCVVAVLVTADAANLKPIFDGRRYFEPQPNLTPLERKTFNDVVYWQAQRAWQDKNTCDNELEILDAATGAYLRPRAVQKAVLYRFCRFARQLGYSGLAIFENGALVRHEVFEGGSEFALGKMPDLNRDGLDELLISYSGINTGEDWMVADIVQLDGSLTRRMTSFDGYQGFCASLEPVKLSKAWKTYVEVGATPRFYQQEFRGLCNSSKPLVQSGRLKPVPRDTGSMGWKRLR